MDYSHLNSAQVRVQSIKEDLKNHDLDHLQSFLQGVSDPEPPNYCKMHGKVEPKLEKVTLKEGANIYNIGNVLFSTDNTVHRVYFAVEKGEIEAYFEAPLPKDSGNPLSLPILDSILMDLLPLWGMKFSAIRRRMTQINDVRAFANNAPNQPEQHLSYGKVSLQCHLPAAWGDFQEPVELSVAVTRRRKIESVPFSIPMLYV